MKQLRPYQEAALQAIRDDAKLGIRRIALQAPTGSGKTLVAAAIAAGAQAKGNRLVFVVPAIALIDQAVEMFANEGIRDIGVIQADHPLTDWAKPIQVASIQTIRSRGAYPEAKVVVIDECHQLHAEHCKWMGQAKYDRETNTTWIEDAAPGWENVPFIGLSATPWTRGLGRYFQTLQTMSTTKELIEQGYLSSFQVFAADHPDLSNVKLTTSDYNEEQLSRVMQDGVLVANIIKTYQERWGKGKTFCFGVDCAHAQALQARFLDAGISCAYQDAKTSRADRAEIKQKFHTGEYQVVCNVGTLTTGVDWDVRCLILARPTRSEILYVQIIGRSLRTAEGKDRAIILDHTDTTSRLGFVTDIFHDTLNGGRFDESGKVIRKAPLPKPCPQCTCLIPVGAKNCPSCGFERKVVSQVYEKEGVLVEFTGSFRKKGQTSERRYPYTEQEKIRFYAQLKGYELVKGYTRGFAWHKYQAKFGVKPSWNIEQAATPMACGPEVTQFIRSEQIKWARSNKNPTNTSASPAYTKFSTRFNDPDDTTGTLL